VIQWLVLVFFVEMNEVLFFWLRVGRLLGFSLTDLAAT